MSHTKDTLTALIAGRYPGGADLTPAGLRKLVGTVWDEAHKAGVANGRALESMEREERGAAFGGILGNLFGRKGGGDG